MSAYTPLKEGYDAAYLARLAAAAAERVGGFPRAAFLKRVRGADWEQLELKARMLRLAEALDACLPASFAEALEVLEGLAPEFGGYLGMFVPACVERRLLADPAPRWERGVLALERVTSASSSEFAVRPLIQHDPARMLAQHLAWTTHPDEHVRRLASEGARPRLPWAMALPALKRDPAPLLPILEALRADPSEYVRRSVANCLNDVSKDHPGLAQEVATRWLHEAPASKTRRRLVKHACRTLLKQGEPATLRLFGFRDPAALRLEGLELEPGRLAIGDTLTFRFTLRAPQALGKLRVEYAVHYRKARGELRPKVFQLSEFESEARERSFTRQHACADLSTRKHHPGEHLLELRVNGVELARAPFLLEPRG